MKEVQKIVKYSSLLSFMLKHTSLLTEGFKENKKSQEDLFKIMFNFGSLSVCRNGRRSVSSYIDVDTRKYQYRLLNPTPLECISGYIMEDSVGYRSLKRMPQRRLNLIDGNISSYCSILNYTERIDPIKQENTLASFFGDIASDYLGEKEDSNMRAMESEDNRKRKS